MCKHYHMPIRRIVQVIGLAQYVGLWLAFYMHIIPHAYYSPVMHASTYAYVIFLLWLIADALRILVEWARYDRYLKKLLIAVAVLTGIMPVLEYVRYITLNAAAWDLGIFMQSLYSTAFYNMLFHYNVELFFNPGGSFLGVHFSPILFLVVPLYYLYPSPITLFIIQSGMVYFSTIAVYLLADYVFREPRHAFIASLTYLLIPAMGGLIYFDFHVESFIPMFYILMMLAYARGRRLEFAIYALLFLLTIEYAQVIALALALVMLIKDAKDRVKLEMAIILAAMAFAMIATVPHAMDLLNPDKPRGLAVYNAFTLGGYVGNPLYFPIYAIHHAGAVASYIEGYWQLKLIYITTNLLPLYPALTTAWFLPAIPYLAVAVLNTANWGFFSNYTQYASYFIPMATVAYVFRLSRVRRLYRALHLLLSLIMAIPLFIFLSPLSPLNLNPTWGNIWMFLGQLNSPPVVEFYKLARLIPANASVLTTNNLFPHFANSLNAYAAPMPLKNWPNYNITYSYIASLNATYILIPKYLNPIEDKWLMWKIKAQNYTLIVNATYYLLYVKQQ